MTHSLTCHPNRVLLKHCLNMKQLRPECSVRVPYNTGSRERRLAIVWRAIVVIRRAHQIALRRIHTKPSPRRWVPLRKKLALRTQALRAPRRQSRPKRDTSEISSEYSAMESSGSWQSTSAGDSSRRLLREQSAAFPHPQRYPVLHANHITT